MLLRHAKAAPSDGSDDYDRELTDRGRADARAVGEMIAKSDLAPDLVIYSGAHRARETTELVLKRLSYEVEAIENNALYMVSWLRLLALMHALPEAKKSVLVVGHNPGLGELASQLAGDGSRELRLRMAAKFPTAALAALNFKTESWADIELRGAKLERFFAPADFR
jgi:phosphohistidine phosphatase